jgi:predicted dehydrogenase
MLKSSKYKGVYKMNSKINIAVVGLQFGGQFAPVYKLHPDVGTVAICELDQNLLNEYGDKFQFDRRFSSFQEVLASDDIDAVHLVTPIHSHAQMSMDALNAGKHCACTVPMGTTIEEIKGIIKAQKTSGKNYMMMETAVYTFQYLHAKEMLKRGEFGRIQFLRGAHYQDMEGWPPYWKGLPPMHYATHAVSPLLAITDTRAVKVHCFGSGAMREELYNQYGNPYPVETAIFQLEKDNLAAEVTRTLFETTRSYMESFNIYGDKASLEWHMEDEALIRFDTGSLEGGRGKNVDSKRIQLTPGFGQLPAEIVRFMSHQDHLDEENPHLSVLQGGAHHGSHPHMVHEFIRSIVEKRKPLIDAITAANWTAAGICAHESAMNGGKEVIIPCFDGN